MRIFSIFFAGALYIAFLWGVSTHSCLSLPMACQKNAGATALLMFELICGVDPLCPQQLVVTLRSTSGHPRVP